MTAPSRKDLNRGKDWKRDRRAGAMGVLLVQIEWAERDVVLAETAAERAREHLATLRQSRDELIFEQTGEWPTPDGLANYGGAMTSTIAPTRSPGFPEDWWDEFEVPDGWWRAEIIEGELVLSPSPGKRHALAATRIVRAFEAGLPEGYEVLQALEWRLDRRVLWNAPIPDILVVPVAGDIVDKPPLLAVEILSPSDFDRLAKDPERRQHIEAKRAVYAANGLEHYLEVDLRHAFEAIRYELVDGDRHQGRRPALVEVDRVIHDEVLTASVPFAYEIMPSAL